MKRFLILIFISILVTGCEKDEPQEPVYEQEITFNVTTVETGLKDVICYVDYVGTFIEPDYAHVIIDGIDYFPLVYRIDGILYTQNIKLSVPPGSYAVSYFALYWDGDTPGGILPEPDDVLLMATPTSSSPYAQYVTKPVTFDITVLPFDKIEVDVEVLCYQEDQYTEFGFDWFVITELVIREQCFFGDICVKHPMDYDGSNYMYQPNGLQMDMPAIMELRLFKSPDGQAWPVDPLAVFTNNVPDSYGAGAPLCIQYADDLGQTDFFKLELWILVKWGDTFVYKWFHDWKFEDGATIPDGTDGIVEFVLGECNLTGTDLQLPPYQDLPDHADITLTDGDPGYWDMVVNSVLPAGTYDLMPGYHIAWCGDLNTSMSGGTYLVDVYTSLYDHEWGSEIQFTLEQISEVNWIFNNLDLWGYDMTNIDKPFGNDLQDAIWYLLEGYGSPNYIAITAQGHTDFQPLPGGWAAVIFEMQADPIPQPFQLVFTIVDP